MNIPATAEPRVPRIFVRAALLTTRRLPVSLGTDAELLAYVKWAQSFGGESVSQLTSATAGAAIKSLLATDLHWQRRKLAIEASGKSPGDDGDDTDKMAIPPPARPEASGVSACVSRGRRRKDCQPAPLTFITPDLLRSRSFNLPLATAAELTGYVAWVAETHNLDRTVVEALAVDRAIREFLRLDRAWQQHRNPQPRDGR